MAKANITEYDSTAGNNTVINDIDISEGCSPSTINNAIRELMAHLKNVDTGSQALTALSVTGNVSVGGTFTSRGIDDNADATAITIDSGENVFIGNTAEFVDGTASTDIGIQLNPIGLVISTRNQGISGIFGRQDTDGDILQFRRNGSAIGSIGVTSSDQVFFTRATGSQGIKLKNSALMPSNADGSDSDNDQDLGSSSVRWKDLYLSSGVFLGGTGSANQISDYEEGTWTPDIRNADNANNFSSEDGTYTKIGNRVCVTFRNDGGNTGGGGSVQIRNLPFSHDGHFCVVGLAGVNGGSLTNRQYNVTANSGTTFHLYNGGSISSETFSYVSGFAVYITNS